MLQLRLAVRRQCNCKAAAHQTVRPPSSNSRSLITEIIGRQCFRCWLSRCVWSLRANDSIRASACSATAVEFTPTALESTTPLRNAANSAECAHRNHARPEHAHRSVSTSSGNWLYPTPIDCIHLSLLAPSSSVSSQKSNGFGIVQALRACNSQWTKVGSGNHTVPTS
eukprot:SAG31_NODE_3613_length_4067_cov_1.304183_2_plen_168_part_00